MLGLSNEMKTYFIQVLPLPEPESDWVNCQYTNPNTYEPTLCLLTSFEYTTKLVVLEIESKTLRRFLFY